MDIYHIWCDLKPGVSDMEFVTSLHRYLDKLRDDGQLVTYRITRAKLGFKPPQLREFHITLEFENLMQLQTAFDHVATRTDCVFRRCRPVIPAEAGHRFRRMPAGDARMV